MALSGFVASSWTLVLEFGEVRRKREDILGREWKNHMFPGDHPWGTVWPWKAVTSHILQMP